MVTESTRTNKRWSSRTLLLLLPATHLLLAVSGTRSHPASPAHQVAPSRGLSSSLTANQQSYAAYQNDGTSQQHHHQQQPSANLKQTQQESQQQQQQQQQLTSDQNQIKRQQQQQAGDEYLIGVGLGDITGPAADINLMGYAKPNQDAGGIHLRQFSRSIIIADTTGNRILYTSIDNGMISQLLRAEVLKRLERKYGPNVYNASNVMLTASHSHSCPGGFFQYLLYNIPSAGFIRQTLEALAGGIVRSVERAHDSMQRGKIYLASGDLLDASVNRSPTSYDNNPAEERQLYKHNTDKTMHLLKFVSSSGEPLAMLNWFPVHGTSMNNTNHLISSDNKGYASVLFEQDLNPAGTQVGRGKFVAIFAQANEGDVSPNTRGPRCVDSGLPCDLATSTCAGQNEKCIAFGPGKDMFESTKIIAYRQYHLARDLFARDPSKQQPIRGPVRYVHEHIDMTNQAVPMYKAAIDLARRRNTPAADGSARAKRRHAATANSPFLDGPPNSTYSTCAAALGYSFAAGTTDGPGAFEFQQADTASSRYWNMVRDFLRRPSRAQIRCQHPKPVLLSTGEMDFPYMWHPKIVPTQILQVGQLAIVGLPGEFTTMAGRRVRNAVRSALLQGKDRDDGASESDLDDEDDDDSDKRRAALRRRMLAQLDKSETQQAADAPVVVLSGLSNIYTSYVTTLEEYEIQRYEGASTLYGPHTLQAYVNQFRRLARRLANNVPAPIGPQPHPPDLTRSLFTLKPGVVYDGAPHNLQFGDLLQDVESGRVYKCGELVSVSFVAGNPRNDLRQEDSFLYVDQYLGNGTWRTVATDASWETKFIWERTNTMFGESRATCQWEIPAQCEHGFYRIRHYGAHKSLLQTISQYSGKSSPFQLGEPAKQELIDHQLLAMMNHNETAAIAAAGTEAGATKAAAVSANPRSKEPEPAYRRGMALLSDMFKRLFR